MNACRTLVLTIIALFAVACTTAGSPAPTPSPTPGRVLALAEQRFALLDEFGTLWYCDPDSYPVGRDEMTAAREQFPGILEDAETFEVILAHLGLPKADSYADADQLAIYREWKVLNAIVLTDIGGGRSQFDLLTTANPSGETGTRTVGTIDEHGTITVDDQVEAGPPMCPICLARGTRIATPTGERAVEALRTGDLVWSIDAEGRRIAVPITALGSIAAPESHRVVHLVLDDGREAWISPRHPLVDGRELATLGAGEAYDGATVVSAALVAYAGERTFDILPDGPTGAYWANGILVGSTLRP